MKVRSGYVSNSSSSSFIVMYNDDSRLLMKPSKTGKGKRKPAKELSFKFDEFLELADRYNHDISEDTCVKADGYESVKDYLTDSDGYGYTRFDIEYAQKIVDLLEKNHNEYEEAAYIQVAYSDKFVRNLLKLFIDSGEVKLIPGDDEDIRELDEED